MAESVERTRRELERRRFEQGGGWLPGASLEEFAVALWFEENRIQYIFQRPFGRFGRLIITDFYILNAVPGLCIEVQGDKFHLGADQVARDLRRASLLQRQGAKVVNVWGRDIVEYPPYAIPTDASFDSLMREAIRGYETRRPY